MEKSILVDPFVNFDAGDSGLKRLVKCPVKEKELCDVAAILITHEHFDHFDKKFVEKAAKKHDSLVVAHDSILNELSLPRRQLVSIGCDSRVSVRGANIKAIPAHHPKAFYPLSFLIEFDGAKIFHAGDTDLMDDYERIKTDVALLPIGGCITMDLGDAVKATKNIRPKFVVPMHYNTFDHIRADAGDFKAKIEKSNLKTKPVVLEPGETMKV